MWENINSMKLLVDDDRQPLPSDPSVKSDQIACKACQAPIHLESMRKLPRKLILERYGLMWGGIETVYLTIYKIQCPSCKKKYSHKVFKSQYMYR